MKAAPRKNEGGCDWLRIGRAVAIASALIGGLAESGQAESPGQAASHPDPWAIIDQAERAVSDRERAGLVGPVRKVVEERVNGPVGLLIRGESRITTKVVEYGDRGTEVFREEYRDWNGELLRTIQHRQDDLGRVVEVMEELWGVTRAPDFFGHIGRVSETWELQEALRYDFEGPTQTIRKRFRYDGDRLAEVEIADTAVGSEIDRRVYDYEAGGRRLKVYSSNDLGDYAPASLSEYRRLPEGTIERVTTHSLYGMDRALFDASGRLVSETIFSGAENAPRTTRRYDRLGREVERLEYDRAGTVQLYRVQTYDSRGHLVETVSRSADGAATRRYTYTDDERGNWIVRTATVGDQPGEGASTTETTFRTITYEPDGRLSFPALATESGQTQ